MPPLLASVLLICLFAVAQGFSCSLNSISTVNNIIDRRTSFAALYSSYSDKMGKSAAGSLTRQSLRADLDLLIHGKQYNADTATDVSKSLLINDLMLLAFNLIVVLPVWLFLLIPTSIISFVGKFIFYQLSGSKAVDQEEADMEAVWKDSFKLQKGATGSEARDYDMIVYGATGFTGQLIVQYLKEKYGPNPGFKWAIGGRNVKRLEEIKESLGPEFSHVGIFGAAADDREALAHMTSHTKVVISTVGPYDLYGSPLVGKCVENGTHYCDITGEADWTKVMIEKYDDLARAHGSKVVHMCGCDSVPWDLLVMKIAAEFKKKQQHMATVDCYDYMKGAASGGTLYTIVNALHGSILNDKPMVSHSNRFVSNLSFDPMLKNQKGDKSIFKVANKLTLAPTWNKEIQAWTGFFVMSLVNGGVVRRSHALQGYNQVKSDDDPNLLSSKILYREGRVFPTFLSCLNDSIITYTAFTALSIPFLVSLLYKFNILPKPGEGPSEKVQKDSFCKVNAIGTSVEGGKVDASIYYPQDVGYYWTARMLCESGLSLALQLDKTAERGGVYTPAAGIGNVLLDRLVDAGVSFSISEVYGHNVDEEGKKED